MVSIGSNPAGAEQVRKLPGHHSLALPHPQFVQERANVQRRESITSSRATTHELRGAPLPLPFLHLSKARSASAVGTRPKREEHDAERLNNSLSVVDRDRARGGETWHRWWAITSSSSTAHDSDKQRVLSHAWSKLILHASPKVRQPGERLVIYGRREEEWASHQKSVHAPASDSGPTLQTRWRLVDGWSGCAVLVTLQRHGPGKAEWRRGCLQWALEKATLAEQVSPERRGKDDGGGEQSFGKNVHGKERKDKGLQCSGGWAGMFKVVMRRWEFSGGGEESSGGLSGTLLWDTYKQIEAQALVRLTPANTRMPKRMLELKLAWGWTKPQSRALHEPPDKLLNSME
ncbi:hypothetical protein EDB92DRAFT_1823240 [Lactarius akahatsu]|uniref:Uncharacterized protein n=1 Tax=Lactarius akahatsu TaxID=416441 RepID=A0AAD4Q4I0_9AGAM|nr:hypothetical protein EDB92DRAFT_1823240 [Lactarius akahatsu]